LLAWLLWWHAVLVHLPCKSMLAAL
jgi:hypothetical protein